MYALVYFTGLLRGWPREVMDTEVLWKWSGAIQRHKKGNTVDTHATYYFKCFLLFNSHTNSVRKVLVFPFFYG